MGKTGGGAARSRLAARESFFGGPLSTREEAKAPGWQAFVKPMPAPAAASADKKAGARSSGGDRKAGGGKKAAAEPVLPPIDATQERALKLKARRDFSGLDDDAPPPPKPSRQQQTAAGPPPRQHRGGADAQEAQPSMHRHRGGQQQQQQQQYRDQGEKVTVKRAPAGGGGKKAVAARHMAVDVSAVGKGRKQLASEALKQRVGEMVAAHAPHRQLPAGSPSGSGTTGNAAAAAAAARAAREAAGAKAVMRNQRPINTATGMQTLQFVSRPPGQAAGRGPALAGGNGRHAASPGSVTKGQRPGAAAAAGRKPRSPAERAAAAAAAGRRPQFRGAFYGGQQPPAALEARMQYNKRRLSMDSGASLDSFIASDDDLDGWLSGGEEGREGGAEEDWRAALREATGGYDPSKFAHVDKLGDRGMEAGYGQIEAEERRALRIARTEDAREAEREALAEAAKRERKEAKRPKKAGAAAFVNWGD